MELNLIYASVITIPAFLSVGELKTQEYLPAPASFSQHQIQRPLTFPNSFRAALGFVTRLFLSSAFVFFDRSPTYSQAPRAACRMFSAHSVQTAEQPCIYLWFVKETFV